MNHQHVHTSNNTHPYFDAIHETVSIKSRTFGPMTVRYRTYGQGQPLLLLHGLMTNGYTWRHVMTSLGKHFTLYIPDFPGAGETPAPSSGELKSEALAYWVEDFLKALKIKRCSAVACDLGAYVAIRSVLVKRRGKPPIQRLACIHPFGVPQSKLYLVQQLLSLPGASELFAWLLRQSPRELISWALRSRRRPTLSEECLFHHAKSLSTYEGSAAMVRTIAETLEPSSLESFFHSLRLMKYTEKKFPVPLMLISGDHDVICPPEHTAKLAATLPNAKIVQIRNASRLVQVDAPDELVEHLLSFFAPEGA